MTMEVEQILHMNGGKGETSYAMNSTIQNIIATSAKSVRQEAVADLYSELFPESLSIADMGCSSGPNALMVASDIIDAVEQRCRQLGRRPPEFQLLLNDLPSNDFNTIFSSLTDFYRRRGPARSVDGVVEEELKRCFVSGVPGSFYGRLFPCNSLHFVHSSSSLHWLSQVPPNLQDEATGIPLNKGKVYISKGSPPSVLDAYLKQFQRDFSLFLKCRAKELVAGGRMVLTLMGRSGADGSDDEKHCYLWDLLAQALTSISSKGLVDEKKIDTFNAPYYAPSMEEIKHEVDRQGSFTIDRMECFEARWDEAKDDHTDHSNGDEASNLMSKEPSSAERMAKVIRAVVECMFVCHFGEDIMEELFERYQGLLEDYHSKNKAQLTNLVVSLVRKP